MNSPQCDIIIPAHNGAKSLKACLQALKEWTNLASSRVMVVNDGSESYTSKWLSEREDIVLLENWRHLGLFRSINRGLYFSIAPYVLLLHPDTLVTAQGWLDRMIRCAERDTSTAMVMPLSNHVPDGQVRIHPGADARLMSDLVKEFGAGFYPDAEALSTFCMLIKRDILRKIGIFDASLEPLGLTEKEFFYRTLKAGYTCKIADDVFVYHGGNCPTDHEDTAAGAALKRSPYDEKWLGELETLKRSDRGKLDYLTDESGFLKCRKQQDPFDLLFVTRSPMEEPNFSALVDTINQLILSKVKAGLVTLNQSSFPFRDDLFFEPLRISERELPDLLPQARLYIATHYRAVPALFEAAHRREAKALYLLTDDWRRFPDENANLAGATYGLIPNHLYTSAWIERLLADFSSYKKRVPFGTHRDLFYPGDMAKPDGIKLTIAAAMKSGPGHGAYEGLAAINKLLTEKPAFQALSFHFLGDRVVGDQEIRSPHFHCHVRPSRQEVATLLRGSDIFMDLCSHPWLSNMGLEAMSSGCACLLARGGWTTDLVKPFENAVLFDPGDQEDLYQKLRILLENATLRAKLQNAAPRLHGDLDIYRSVLELVSLVKDLDQIPPLPPLDGSQFLKAKLSLMEEEMESCSRREGQLIRLQDELIETKEQYDDYLHQFMSQKIRIEALEASLRDAQSRDE